MGEMDGYKASCDFIRKEFKLDKAVSLYSLVNTIVGAYKDLKDKEEVRRLKVEELADAKQSQIKEKSNVGRPKKSS